MIYIAYVVVGGLAAWKAWDICWDIHWFLNGFRGRYEAATLWTDRQIPNEE